MNIAYVPRDRRLIHAARIKRMLAAFDPRPTDHEATFAASEALAARLEAFAAEHEGPVPRG